MDSNSEASEQTPLPIRKLEITDASKGFLELLSQLSPSPAPTSPSVFQSLFADLLQFGDDHLVVVVEDPETNKIIATGTVFVEKKFLRGCAKAGHIEDVVVDSSVRGKGLGKRVVEYLVEHVKRMGCYKVILDCSEERQGFYETCGFQKKSVQMAVYF